LSDYVLVDDYMIYRAAEGRDFAELALAEPVSCVARGIRRTPLAYGDVALVQGAGIMGQLHVQLLRLRGVRVVVTEPDPQRRADALAQGAAAIDPAAPDLAESVADMTDGIGLAAVFFTAGGVPAIRSAIPLLAKGGWLMLYGSVHPRRLALDPNGSTRELASPGRTLDRILPGGGRPDQRRAVNLSPSSRAGGARR
jgi:L-iditol 2-dehydrogenase